MNETGDGQNDREECGHAVEIDLDNVGAGL
jgi:hypothetical protein